MSRGGDKYEGWLAVTTVGEKRTSASEVDLTSADSAHTSGSLDTTGTRRAWQAAYVRRLFWTDAIIVTLSVLLAHIVRFGHENLLTMDTVSTLNYTLISVGIAVVKPQKVV